MRNVTQSIEIVTAKHSRDRQIMLEWLRSQRLKLYNTDTMEMADRIGKRYNPCPTPTVQSTQSDSRSDRRNQVFLL